MWCSLSNSPVGFCTVSSLTSMVNSLFIMHQIPKGQAHQQLWIAFPARISMKCYPWYVVFCLVWILFVVQTVVTVFLLLLSILLGHLTAPLKPTSVICWIQNDSGFMLQQILSIQWIWIVTQYSVALGRWMVNGVAQLNIQIQCAVWWILQHVLFCNLIFIVSCSVGYFKIL